MNYKQCNKLSKIYECQSNELILTLSTIKNDGYMSCQGFKKLTELGIPILTILIDKLSELGDVRLSKSYVYDMVLTKQISSKFIECVFIDIIDKHSAWYVRFWSLTKYKF